MSRVSEISKEAAGGKPSLSFFDKGPKATIYTGFAIAVAAFLLFGGVALHHAGGSPSASSDGQVLSWILLFGAAFLAIGSAVWTGRSAGKALASSGRLATSIHSAMLGSTISQSAMTARLGIPHQRAT